MLEERIADLERRVAALEGGSPLDLVEQLRERGGGLTYAGAVEREGQEFLWVRRHEVDDVLATDWPATAAVLASLGNPARLALLASLLAGPRGRPELQGDASTGQLYHHLKDLQAAGLVHQPKRGRYEVAAHAVVPLLTILSAAGDIGAAGPS